MFTQEESCLQELWCSIRVTRPAEPIQKYTSLAHRKLSSAIEAIWLMSTHFEASVDGKIITSYIQVGKTVTWLLRLEEWWKILTLKTFQGVYAFEHKLKMVNTFTCFVQYICFKIHVCCKQPSNFSSLAPASEWTSCKEGPNQALYTAAKGKSWKRIKFWDSA